MATEVKLPPILNGEHHCKSIASLRKFRCNTRSRATLAVVSFQVCIQKERSYISPNVRSDMNLNAAGQVHTAAPIVSNSFIWMCVSCIDNLLALYVFLVWLATSCPKFRESKQLKRLWNSKRPVVSDRPENSTWCGCFEPSDTGTAPGERPLPVAGESVCEGAEDCGISTGYENASQSIIRGHDETMACNVKIGEGFCFVLGCSGRKLSSALDTSTFSLPQPISSSKEVIHATAWMA